MLLCWRTPLLLPDLPGVFFCFVGFVFLWFAWIFLLLLARRLIHTSQEPASISATSWTGTANVPDLIPHFILCAFFPSKFRLIIGSRERVLAWTSGRVTFLAAALLDSLCPPFDKPCWCRGCLCQTDVAQQGSRMWFDVRRGFPQLLTQGLIFSRRFP